MAGPGGSSRRRWILFTALAAVVLIADQSSKAWVDSSFALAWTRAPVPSLADPSPVLGDLVRIAKTYNSGGIFGLFGDAAPVLAVASIVVIGLIVLYQARQGSAGPLVLTIALGLLLGGAIGNLIDRVRFGYVVDFVDMGLGDLRFYTFNVADSAISTAIALLVLMSLFGERLARRTATRADAPVTATDGADAGG